MKFIVLIYCLILQTPVRNHRRSRSAGADRWLDHRPENVAPLDTLLQPKMKKKKSVGKLEVKDTNKASKYVLTTQNADHRGHVETKLVKVKVILCCFNCALCSCGVRNKFKTLPVHSGVTLFLLCIYGHYVCPSRGFGFEIYSIPIYLM